jgi:hypothetical protein
MNDDSPHGPDCVMCQLLEDLRHEILDRCPQGDLYRYSALHSMSSQAGAHFETRRAA